MMTFICVFAYRKLSSPYVSYVNQNSLVKNEEQIIKPKQVLVPCVQKQSLSVSFQCVI